MEPDTLLHPVTTGAERCGSDLIFSTEFDAIREARRFDDPSLSQGEWVTPIKDAQWDKVTLICQDILINKSKDLRVIGWLAEASAKTDGLNGLARSYRLLTRLCEIYWEDIHPQFDDGDPEQRIGALDWLLGQSAQWIRETPLTRSPRGTFSLVDQESARNNTRNNERNPEQAGDYSPSALTIEIFEAAASETPGSHYTASLQAALDLQQTMTALRTVLDGYLAEQAPSFGPAFDALDNVIHFLRRYTPETNADANMDKTSAAAAAVPAVTPAPTVAQGAPLSREQAIHQLQEIAAFFRRSEPHSPVAYLADQAARWGSMPLHEWLRSVVRDEAALSHVEELLGIERRLPENDGG
ncbi:MAG: type VI secretion system protein TssA [Azonexus sp.]|jgi:type VI secretion system protein ImpA|uniref:type VI secretion system protein TssA n=1 Tax=Azonexus sp. TaxID=1872668 RepID=UPI00283184C9|nr:type VI secretion system protein TssA [Azonexus sp.]MDR0777366.1 type VI secretion system protein TssA [Azonexus sp.]